MIEASSSPERLSDEDGGALLRLARGAIAKKLGVDNAALRECLDTLRLSPGLEKPRGAFVTLTETGGALRGCIGRLSSTAPLYRTVIEMAPQAACEDPRFPPLTGAELDRVRISVSVLTPLSPVSDPREIVIGRDGVFLERGERRAVFLPRVAVDQGWDRSRLLEQLSRKAGLAPDAWRTADLYVFGGESFAETDPSGCAGGDPGRKITKY